MKPKAAQQPLITAAFKQPLPAQTDRAEAITNAIGVFIGADMRPYSVVQNEGFKYMLNVLEPRYIFFFADPKNDPIRDSDPRNDPNREFFDPLHP